MDQLVGGAGVVAVDPVELDQSVRVLALARLPRLLFGGGVLRADLHRRTHTGGALGTTGKGRPDRQRRKPARRRRSWRRGRSEPNGRRRCGRARVANGRDRRGGPDSGDEAIAPDPVAATNTTERTIRLPRATHSRVFNVAPR